MRIHLRQGDVIAAQHSTGWTAFFEDKDVVGEGETMMDAITDLHRNNDDRENEDTISRRDYDLQRAAEYRRQE